MWSAYVQKVGSLDHLVGFVCPNPRDFLSHLNQAATWAHVFIALLKEPVVVPPSGAASRPPVSS